MPGNETLILAVVGMAGSGKTIACDFFKSKGYPVLRFGDETDRGLQEQGLALTEANERQYREELRKKLGMAAYAIKIEPRLNKALADSPRVIVLDGLYSWEEYLYLQPKFPQLKLLAVYSRPESRYQRLAQRATRSLATLEQARQRDRAEIEQSNKAGPIALADYLVVNEGTVVELQVELERALDFFKKVSIIG